MANQPKSSKALDIALWTAQLLLAAGFIWAASMKLFQPIDKLSAMWPWAGQIPVFYVRGLGIIDLLGGLGIILPSLLRTWPRLTSLTAIGIIVLMICAIVFHVSRGEASVIGVNFFFAFLAAFVAWGRWRS